MKTFFFSERSSYFAFLFFLFGIFSSSAQTTLENDGFLDHVRFGGSLGLSFTSNFFTAHLAPKAVYDFNRYFSAGIGTAGTYSDGSNFSAFTVGASAIGMFRPLRMLQFSAEMEENYVSKNFEYDGANLKDSYWYPSLFLGIGYTTGPVTAGLRYDVLYDDQKSIYGSALMPFVSFYF